MRCRQTQRLFGLYCDGLLDPESAAGLKAHLGECTVCANKWRRYRQTVHLLHALPAASMSELGCRRVKRLLADIEPQPGAAAAFRPARRAVMAAVAASVAVLAYLGWQELRPPTATPAEVRFAQPQATSESLILRDAQSGGWVDPARLIEDLKRSDRRVAIVPRLRVDSAQVQPLLRRQQRHMAELIRQTDLQNDRVHFLSPVTIGGTLLDGPPVEWWVMQPRSPKDVALGR